MEPTKRWTRKRVAIVIVAALLIVASSWVIWETFRPRNMCDLTKADRFAAGQEVALEGTITFVYRENTSYGPAVYLGMDSCAPCGAPGGGSWAVRGDPNSTYRTGDRFHTTLHFSAYRFNGDPAVWAPEVVCPFPVLARAIGTVWDAVSTVAGFPLLFRGTDPGGWSRYEVVTTQGDAYRADVLPVTLRRSPPALATTPELRGRDSINSAASWITVFGVQYILVAGMFGPASIVDDMGSAADGTSRNRMIRFVDADGDGLVGDGDRIDIRLPDAGGETSYDTYMLQVGEVAGTFGAYTYAGHYILNGPRGPLEAIPSLSFVELAHLRHVGDQIGARVTSIAAVSRVRLGTPQATTGLRFGISVNGSGEILGNLADLPQVLANGVSLNFIDRNITGRFDAGDEFVVGNLDNRTGVRLVVRDANQTIATADWITGYGHVVGSRFPDVTLTATGAGPYRVDVDVRFWHPELAPNRTVRASLRENSTPVLRDLVLSNGTIGTFANGTLSFTDADGDGFLSTGDFFGLQGSPSARYELEVSMLFGAVSHRVTFGP